MKRELVLFAVVVPFAAALPVLVTVFAEPAVQREAARPGPAGRVGAHPAGLERAGEVAVR